MAGRPGVLMRKLLPARSPALRLKLHAAPPARRPHPPCWRRWGGWRGLERPQWGRRRGEPGLGTEGSGPKPGHAALWRAPGCGCFRALRLGHKVIRVPGFLRSVPDHWSPFAVRPTPVQGSGCGLYLGSRVRAPAPRQELGAGLGASSLLLRTPSQQVQLQNSWGSRQKENAGPLVHK